MALARSICQMLPSQADLLHLERFKKGYFHYILECVMSKDQYEWIVAIALTMNKSKKPDDEPRSTTMEYIDAVSGRLTPSERTAANDSQADPYNAAMIGLVLVAMCAISRVIFFLRIDFRAKSTVPPNLSVIPFPPSISVLIPLSMPSLPVCQVSCPSTPGRSGDAGRWRGRPPLA